MKALSFLFAGGCVGGAIRAMIQIEAPTGGFIAGILIAIAIMIISKNWGKNGKRT